MCREKEYPHNYFSQRFKAVREAAGLSILALGEKTEVNRATIYRYETGESVPKTLNIWISLAKAHKMSLPEYMDALFGIKNIQPDSKRLDDELNVRIAKLEAIIKKCPLMEDTS